MCVISNTHDQYQPLWPYAKKDNGHPLQNAMVFRERTALELFEEIIMLTKKLDAALGLPDCESAHETEWMEEVRKRVREHEVAKVEARLK